MADDLDPVTQEFTADTAEYTAAIDEATAAAEDFAVSAEEAAVALDSVRDHAAEAAAALDIYQDAAGRWRNSSGQFASSAEIDAAGVGHLRDEAVEAAASVKELGDQAEETAAKLDLMGLAGASSYTSLGPLVGLIGAAVVAAAAAAPAFAAMGLGIGAFGALAIPTLSGISSGYETISADQTKLQAATTAAAKSTALAQLQHDWAQIPAPIADAVKQIMAFKNEFTALGQSSGIQNDVLNDLTKGLQIVDQLLPKIVPLAQAGAQAVSGIISVLGTALQSSPFLQFLTIITQMVGPATQAITQLGMALSGLLGNALETLMGNSVPFIRFITFLVQNLSGPLITALNIVIGLFLSLMSALEPLIPPLSQIATVLIQDIGQSFAAFIPIIQQVVQILGGSLIQILNDLLPVIANALTPNSPFMMALNQLPALLNAVLPLITGLVSILSNPAVAQAAVWVVSLVVAFKGLMGVVSLLSGAFTFLIGLPELIMGIVAAIDIAAIATRAWAIAQMLLDLAEDLSEYGMYILAIAAVIAIIILIVTHLHLFAEAFDVVRHAVAEAGHDIASVFDQVRHDIMAALDDVINWIKSNWKLIVSWLVDPIGTAVMEIKDHTHEIAQTFDQMRHDVAAIVDGTGKDIETAWDTARHNVAATVDAIPGDIEKAFDTIRHDVAALGDDALNLIKTAWNQFVSVNETMVKDVLAFFQKLPGQVVSFLASLPGQMLTIGENVIKGLINGILNAAAQIPSIMGQLASDVASYFTDPLKLFSPSRLFFEHGYNIVQGAINGIKANAPQLLATMRGLGGQVATQGLAGSSLAAGAIAPATGSTTVHVPVQVTAQGMTPNYNDPQFTQYIQGVVQEGVLRYGQLNPGNGLTPAWGH